MAANPEAAVTEQSGPGLEGSVSPPPDILSEQPIGLSDRFASAFRQLSELEANLQQHLAELERRQGEIAERLAALTKCEQQLERQRQELEQRHRELEECEAVWEQLRDTLTAEGDQIDPGRAALGEAEQPQAESEGEGSHLAQLRTRLQAGLKRFEAQRQQFAAQQAELAQRLGELAAQETALRQRELAVDKFQQAFAQMATSFGNGDEPSEEAAEAQALEPPETLPAAADDEHQPHTPPTPPAESERESAPEEQQAAGPNAAAEAPPESSETAAEQAPAEGQPPESCAPEASPGDESSDAADGQQPSQQVIEGDYGASESLETVDLSDQELRKMRVLRRLGSKLSDAELIARVRGERSAGLKTAEKAGKRGGKRRWWK